MKLFITGGTGFKWVFILISLMLSQQEALPQHSEVGVKVVLSGALMFGPYYSYWIDDRNAFNGSVLAAVEEEGELVFPFALNASYNAYFFKGKWRPELGIQYSYLISPGRSKSPDDPKGISIISLVPGVQFRWDDMRQNVQTTFWLAHFLDKQHNKEKFRIFPVGLEFSYGYKFLQAD